MAFIFSRGISFYNSGASKGSSVSFLISTPQTGMDSIMVTYSLLGLPMAIVKPFIALFTGFFGGFLTKVLLCQFAILYLNVRISV
jgi:uncharacterized membrane protein YraQ (UPF0718 family)